MFAEFNTRDKRKLHSAYNLDLLNNYILQKCCLLIGGAGVGGNAIPWCGWRGGSQYRGQAAALIVQRHNASVAVLEIIVKQF